MARVSQSVMCKLYTTSCIMHKSGGMFTTHEQKNAHKSGVQNENSTTFVKKRSSDKQKYEPNQITIRRK